MSLDGHGCTATSVAGGDVQMQGCNSIEIEKFFEGETVNL